MIQAIALIKNIYKSWNCMSFTTQKDSHKKVVSLTTAANSAYCDAIPFVRETVRNGLVIRCPELDDNSTVIVDDPPRENIMFVVCDETDEVFECEYEYPEVDEEEKKVDLPTMNIKPNAIFKAVPIETTGFPISRSQVANSD
jgi:hypothetical protein